MKKLFRNKSNVISKTSLSLSFDSQQIYLPAKTVTATISLVNEITDEPLDVKVISSKENIIPGFNCRIAKGSKSCEVTLNLLSIGDTTFTATAKNYIEAIRSISVLPAEISIKTDSDVIFANDTIKFTIFRPAKYTQDQLALSVISDNNGAQKTETCSIMSNKESGDCIIKNSENVGTIEVLIVANGYKKLNYTFKVTPTTILINIPKNKLLVNSSTTIYGFVPKYINVEVPIKVYFSSSNNDIIKLTSDSCNIMPGNSNDNSCSITATALQITQDNITITASADKYEKSTAQISTIEKPIIKLSPEKTSLGGKDITKMTISISEDIADFNDEIPLNISTSSDSILQIDSKNCTISKTIQKCDITIKSHNNSHSVHTAQITVKGDKIDEISQTFRINGVPL